MRILSAAVLLSLVILSGCEDMSDEDFDTMNSAMQTIADDSGGGSGYSGPAADPDQAIATALVRGTVNAAITDGDPGEAFADGVVQSLQNSTGGGVAGGPALASNPASNFAGGNVDVPPGHDNLAADSCPGFTDENYQTRSFQGGPDTQLFTLCGAAYNYYHMYRRALVMGYTPDQAEVTYQAHRKAALVVTQFVRDAR